MSILESNSFFLVPPTLRALPHNGQVTARKGSTVTLECKASGNPVPTIYWFKKDVFAGPTHLSDSSTLILENVDRHHAGIYQCSADNGVKERVSMDIQLTILCRLTHLLNKTNLGYKKKINKRYIFNKNIRI